MKINTTVTAKIPSLHGPMKVMGKVTGVREDKMIEVKTQLHGYHFFKGADVKAISF